MTDKSNTPAEHKDSWRTPPELFSALNAEFSFNLDAAASPENALCRHFITEEQNTLETSWNWVRPDIPGYVWLNPPYSDVSPFVKKASEENHKHGIGCVMLLNADTSVGWFREAISTAHEVRFITGGRLAFLSAETGKPVSGNNKGQMLIIWHPWPRTNCEMKTIDRDALLSFGARLIKRGSMMGKVNVERTNEYRQVVQQYITEHPGSQTNQISKILHVGHRRASTILLMLSNCGDIYRAGHHNVTRYWISAAACKKDGVCADAEQETFDSKSKATSSRYNQHRRTSCSSMVFLSRRRPEGINTIFEECKRNSQILPVLQVMAARRVA